VVYNVGYVSLLLRLPKYTDTTCRSCNLIEHPSLNHIMRSLL